MAKSYCRVPSVGCDSIGAKVGNGDAGIWAPAGAQLPTLPQRRLTDSAEIREKDLATIGGKAKTLR